MGWKSKFTRRKIDKRGKTETGHKCCHGDGLTHLKSCLKKKSIVNYNGEGECSFFSSSASFRSGESGLIDRRTSVDESLQTRSTDLSSSSRSSIQSRARKNVRFHEIHIREYKRTVGDNPSVSNGPPVGIDWKFEETVKMDINCYESYRGTRREHLEMVLTRHERESLLMEWGVPTHLIADGTRSALKVKNQRKQTIVNVGKVSRLEEAIESASRRFKVAFSVKSRSNHAGEDDSDIRMNVVSTTMRMDPPRAVDGGPQDNSITCTASQEPDTNDFEKMGIPCISNVVSEASKGTITARCSVNQHKVINDDDGYTFGGTTFGNNSVSPSVLEMENFYQELELEMFGEEASLPCMIGQTLEVSTYENDNDIDDGVDDMTIASSSHPFGRNQMATVTAIATYPHHGPRPDEYQVQGRLVSGNSRSQPLHHHVSDFPHHSPASTMQYTPPPSIWTQHSAHQQSMVIPRERTSSYDAFSDRNGESCDGKPQLNFSSTQRQLYHFQVSTSNPMPCWNEHAGRININYVPSFVYPDNRYDERYDEQECFDGPRIYHTSLQHGHLSPHQWMEECDEPRSYVNGSVTITEDDLS